jgi:hypothetical protein
VPEFQCALASNQRDEPIFATASQVRRWLLVEVRGSWGRDSVDDTELGRHVDDAWRNRMRSAGIRLVAIRRDLERTANQPTRLCYIDHSAGRLERGRSWTTEIAGLHHVADATAEFPEHDEGGAWSAHAEPIILVCTNGRHDACCATFGRPVVRALRTSVHAPGVWECSHIGGDRFAGNVVVLADGLYFGRCTAETGVAVCDAYRRGELLLDHYRGRSTLGYLHQAAEYFARRELGVTAIDAVTAVERVGDASDGTFVVTVHDVGRVDVTVRRSIVPAPTALTCTGPAGVTMPRYLLAGLRVPSS